ncbi:flagellar basal-body rod modification protein FlgD [Desulfobaculum xiamenense]|uniref:Basal-body rod modification protein FlgD n=1 Tax=Desulfobaculum xiamenense TaxID=995050 RepID=A0A846QUY7_9BACT|nr:flagellar hook assembly protein FlgD [Desulfobaculum xiamenense]NJB68459.1 flagellar basal-body rod modification protein FlgD [Desulfobaculum xiamenense]
MQTYDAGNIIGRAEKELYDTRKFTGKSELDKEDFLTLLVAQLQHQDPLNPMDDKEFTSQLAEFSNLEQLTAINKGVASLSQQTIHQEMVNASNFIGKEVRALGDNLSIREDGSVSQLFYALKSEAQKVYMNIFDKDSNIIRTIQLGSQAAGEHDFQWDGKDWRGNALPEGLYYVALAAEGKDGEAILTQTEVSGLVEGVQYANGQNYLRLSDGRVVAFNFVKEVVKASAGNETEQDAPTEE